MKSYSFKNFLTEAPIPDDWDSSIFNKSFAKRIEYAKQKAAKLGTGSSRVAFVIPFEGRDTVLKIAKNAKGIAQNNEEVNILNDWYAEKTGIFIPLIDFDRGGDNVTWIHTEKAEKMTPSKFKQLVGAESPLALVAYVAKMFNYRNYKNMQHGAIDEDNETVQAFVDYVGNYNPNIADYTRLANWGIFDNRAVIIDAGFSEEVSKLYFK